jgi:D-alanyl-D-alanine carboxypeptidase
MTNSPFKFEGRNVQDGKFVLNPQFEWAGGGFISTSSDLALWVKVMYEGKSFPHQMLAVMEESVPAKTVPEERYGLGVQERHTEFGVSYGHGGWFPGYLSEMEYFPKYRVALAIQLNTDDIAKIRIREHDCIMTLGHPVFAGLN